jgi:hypothetical protein
MRTVLKALLAVAGIVLATQAGAQVKMFSERGFNGHQFDVNGPMRNLDRTGFNDKAESLIVEHGRWQVCENAYFQGRCVTLQPGQYGSLGRMGLKDRISSIRPIENYGRNDRDRYGYNEYDRRGYNDYDRR